MRDLQAEAVDLRTDNARLTTSYSHLVAELQAALAEVDRLKSKPSSASANDGPLRRALQLITATADEALGSALPWTEAADDEDDHNRAHSAQSHHFEEGDTILASSAGALSNHRDRQPPLVSSKPDLSLIDEVSQEESFYKQSLPWYRPSSAPPEDLHFLSADPAPSPSSLLPPSVVFSSTRPRRSSSTASLRPMLDECVLL